MSQPLALASLAQFARLARIWQAFWLGLVVACVLAMHSLGAVHAVLHAEHGHGVHAAVVAKHKPQAAAHGHHQTPLEHDAGGLACLVLEAISTAAAPLLAWPVLVLVWPLGAFVLPAVPGPHLAFLFLHPPAARAPPWF